MITENFFRKGIFENIMMDCNLLWDVIKYIVNIEAKKIESLLYDSVLRFVQNSAETNLTWTKCVIISLHLKLHSKHLVLIAENFLENILMDCNILLPNDPKWMKSKLFGSLLLVNLDYNSLTLIRLNLDVMQTKGQCESCNNSLIFL